MAQQEDIFDRYVDREGVISDTDFAISEINRLLGAIKEANNAKVDINKSGSFSTLTDGLKKYETAQKTVIESNKNLEASTTRAINSQRDLDRALLEGRVEKTKYNAELKQEINLQNSANGSIEQARAKLALLRAERNKLDLSTSGGQKQKEDLNAQIDLLDEFIKKNVDAYTKQKINVGNYSGAMKVLEKTLLEVKDKMDKLAASGQQDTEVFQTLQKEFSLLNGVVNNQANGFVTMRQEIQANEAAIEQLIKLYGKDSEAVKQLIQENADLRDSFKDLKAEQETLGSDTFAFDSLLQGGQALVGMYSAAEGATALFGAETEDLQKTMVKLQAAMALVQGVQAVVNALQREGALVQGLLQVRTYATAAAMRVYTFVTAGATAAARTFNAALIASGIGIVLALIVTAANAMGAFGDETEDATESLEDFNEALEYSKTLLDNYDQYLQHVGNIEQEHLKQRGASETELTNAKIKNINLRKAANDSEIQDLKEKQGTLLTSEKDFSKKSNAIEDEILDRKKANLKFDQEIELEREQLKTKIADKSRENQKNAAERSKQYREAEFKAQFELEKYYLQKQIDESKAIYENQTSPLTIRLGALMNALDKEEKLITATRDFSLAAENVTESQRKLIIQRSEDELLAIRRNAAAQTIAIRRTVDALSRGAMVDVSTERNRRRVEDLQNTLDQELEMERLGANEKIRVQLRQYTNELITKEQYEEAKAIIENEARANSLRAQIRYYQDLIKIANLDPEEQKNALKSLADYEQQLLDLSVANTEKANAKKTASNENFFKKYSDRLFELGTEINDTIFSVLEGGIERQKNAIQGLIDKLEEQKRKEIEGVNASVASQQDKAAQIAIIEARSRAQREALERRQRELDVQRARFERAKAVMNIIANTAQGITAALASVPPNPILAAIVGAIGAAQLVRTLATPIPRYFKGKNLDNLTYDNYQGYAWINDGGKKEAIIRENGKVEYPQKMNSIHWVGKNDIVVPDAKMLALSATRAAYEYTTNSTHNTNNESNQLSQVLNKGFSKTVKAIKELPGAQLIMPNPLDIWMNSGKSWDDFRNR